jgi:ArsR family metal-binding transcriptional regulator
MNLESPVVDRIAVFSRDSEYAKARSLLEALRAPFEVVSPEPACLRVACSALVCNASGLSAILNDHAIVCAGWTFHHGILAKVAPQPPEDFEEDVFGEAAIMFFGPCMADENRIRLIAHLSGDLRAALPYLNSTLPQACFNAGPCTLTFMDGYRMVTLYPRRIAIGKADDLVDGWRTLERLRRLVNSTWARRHAVVPSYDQRSKPPMLEIYKRLPRTNCRQCGEQTCMAFAASLWQGRATPSQCRPAFTAEYAALRGALLEICGGLGSDTRGPAGE